jgi:hypothetical protein
MSWVILIRAFEIIKLPNDWSQAKIIVQCEG